MVVWQPVTPSSSPWRRFGNQTRTKEQQRHLRNSGLINVVFRIVVLTSWFEATWRFIPYSHFSIKTIHIFWLFLSLHDRVYFVKAPVDNVISATVTVIVSEKRLRRFRLGIDEFSDPCKNLRHIFRIIPSLDCACFYSCRFRDRLQFIYSTGELNLDVSKVIYTKPLWLKEVSF